MPTTALYPYGTSHLIPLYFLPQILPPLQTTVQKPKFRGVRRTTSRAPKGQKPNRNTTECNTEAPSGPDNHILKYTQRLAVLGALRTVGLFMAAARHRTLSLTTFKVWSSSMIFSWSTSKRSHLILLLEKKIELLNNLSHYMKTNEN